MIKWKKKIRKKIKHWWCQKNPRSTMGLYPVIPWAWIQTTLLERYHESESRRPCPQMIVGLTPPPQGSRPWPQTLAHPPIPLHTQAKLKVPTNPPIQPYTVLSLCSTASLLGYTLQTSSRFRQSIAHCTLHTAHCTLHTSHWILLTIHCTLHTKYCTLHTKHLTLNTKH